MSACTPLHSPSRRRLLIGAAAGLLGPAVASARTVGSGRVQSETRAIGDFEAIAVAGSIDLEVRQAAQPSLTLSADDNLLPLVETVVEPGRHGPTLHVRLRRGETVSTRTPIKVTVDVVKLKAIAAAGSGDVRVSALQTPSLRLTLAGSTDARLEGLATEQLDLSIAGSGNVVAAGRAGQLKLSISGSGDADLSALAADDVKVGIAGSGDAQVTANKALSVSVAGSGDVVYGGAVTTVSSKVAGSGSVRRR